MKKRLLLCALVGLVALGGCKKDPIENPDPETPTTLTKNVFSVARDRQVSIAPGNLQYRASANLFRFAPNAWDFVGEDNLIACATFEDWIDLFGWGTSGADGIMPYESSESSSNYYSASDLTGTEYDWGQHNAIRNGSATDPAGTWRTPSRDELEYIVGERSASTVQGVNDARYLMATVNGQTGLILFPDLFSMPEDFSFPVAANINHSSAYADNAISSEQWSKLESEGCAFLPACGCKNVSNNSLVAPDYLGCYWTSTRVSAGVAAQLWFNPNMCEAGQAQVIYSRSVRLVRDL